MEALSDTVLAVICRKEEWFYLAADIDFWIMDWRVWYAEYVNAGYSTPSGEARDRDGIWVLDADSVDRSLKSSRVHILSEVSLRSALREQMPIREWHQVSHLFPAIYIDFDSKILRSVYSETIEVERYVPAGWDGAYREFYDLIPIEHRYSIDGETDYLRLALER